MASSRTALAVRTRRPSQDQKIYVQFALRWWWAIALGLVIGCIGAIAYTQYGPVSYTSTASLIVPSQASPGQDSLGETRQLRVAAASYAAQAASAPVYEGVSRALAETRPMSPSEVMQLVQQRRIDIRPPRDSNLITVTVTDLDPEFAELLANTYAEVFSKQVNAQAQADLAGRQRELEKQIASTTRELTSSQLAERERDLVKEQQAHRAQLLQLQLQYQQELQRQVESQAREAKRAGQPAGPDSPPPPDTEQIQAAAETSVAAREQALQLMVEQQKNEEAAIAALDQQIAQVRRDGQAAVVELTNQINRGRAELASLTGSQAPAEGEPAPDLAQRRAEVDARLAQLQQEQMQLQQQQREQDLVDKQVQAQRSELQQREQALNTQVQTQRGQVQQIQGQIQQEKQRQVQIVAQARQVGLSGGGEQSKDQKRALERQRETAQAAARQQTALSNETISMLEQRQRDAERSVGEASRDLAQVRAQLAELPAQDPGRTLENQRRLGALDLEIKAAQQQQRQLEDEQKTQATNVRDTQSRGSQIQAREQDLQKQIRDARAQAQQREQEILNEGQSRRGRLLQLQAQYHQEVQKQAEADRRAAEAEQRQAQTPPPPDSPGAVLTPEQQQAAAHAKGIHAQWLSVVSAQIADVERNLMQVGEQLTQVRALLVQYPPSTDSTISTTFAGAYTSLLQNLTRDYVRLQLNAQDTQNPVERYGVATEAITTTNLRRLLALGAATGAGLAVALAFLWDWRRGKLQPNLYEEGLVDRQELDARRKVLPDTDTSAGLDRVARARGRRDKLTTRPRPRLAAME